MKKLLLTLFLSLTIMFGFSQTYNMTDGSTINTCTGTFYDPEGTSPYIDHNGTITQTFCSDNGNSIKFIFTAFETTENKDVLKIYDGPTTAATLIGTYDKTDVIPNIVSTGTCITFEWTTDNGGDGTVGWVANISCVVAETCFDGIMNQDETWY